MLLVLQRSQTAIHFADIVSALDLTAEASDGVSELNATLQSMVGALNIVTVEDAQPFVDRFATAASARLGRTITADDVRVWLQQTFGTSLTDIAFQVIDKATESQILLEEWPALTTPTIHPTMRAQLVVRRDSDVRSPFQEATGLITNVYLIERLRELRAFRGFHRVRPNATLVPPDLGIVPRQAWLPAIEVFGEGIFLELSLRAISSWETAEQAGLTRRLRKIESNLATGVGPVERFAHLAPFASRFMMTHTFAHLLMRQLCYESGYGSASVRERLYVFEDRVGILIYTADGDSEGSLGGLVRQGRNDRLAQTIAAALERATWCSNDPICREIPEHGFEKLALASCHACALVPETSCSQLNALLDRELVIGDGTAGVQGFFTEYLHGVQSTSVV